MLYVLNSFVTKMASDESSKTGPVRYPGETDTAHPEVFNTMPKQPDQKKPGQLPEKMIKQFFEKVFTVSFCPR